MSIENLIQFAMDAREEKNLQTRRLIKSQYQLLFFEIIRCKPVLKNWLKENAMEEECKFLANVFFENADLLSRYCIKREESSLSRSSPSPAIFRKRLEMHVKQIVENGWAALAKLKIAILWKNLLNKDSLSLEDHEKQILKNFLLKRTTENRIWENFNEKLTPVVSKAQHFNFCQKLSSQGSYWMFAAALIVIISLFFIPFNTFAAFFILSIGLLVFMTSLALDAYGRFQKAALLNAIKKDIAAMPLAFQEKRQEEESTDEIELSRWSIH